MSAEDGEHPDLALLQEIPHKVFDQVGTVIKSSIKLTATYKDQCLRMCIETRDQMYRAQIQFTKERKKLVAEARAEPGERQRVIFRELEGKMLSYTKCEYESILEPLQVLVSHLWKTERKLWWQCVGFSGAILLKDLCVIGLVATLISTHCVACIAFTMPIWGWVALGLGVLGSITITVCLMLKIVTWNQIRTSILDTMKCIKDQCKLYMPKFFTEKQKEPSSEALSKELESLLQLSAIDADDWLLNEKLEFWQRRLNDKSIALTEDRERFQRDNNLLSTRDK